MVASRAAGVLARIEKARASIPPTGESMTDNPFDNLAARYDAWFDSLKGQAVFPLEVECVRRVAEHAPRPWLEVGVGTGRFAEALGIDEGIDPSAAVLALAADRGLRTRLGRAEALPYPDSAFGCAFLIVTFCFLDDPAKALHECARVLAKDGSLIVGLVPADSPWGKLYAHKASEGHPFYKVAKFYTCDEAIQLAQQAGLGLDEAASCLLTPPDIFVPGSEAPKQGIVKDAGFVAIRFTLSE